MAAKPNRVLGQGKRKVWVGVEVAANHKPKKTVKLVNSVPPHIEALRSRQLSMLRKSFIENCGEVTPPVLCFERWLLDNMLVNQLAK